MSSTNNLPRSECPECGRPCRTISGICGPCQGIGVDTDALRGGRWVIDGRVQRWKPWTDEECAERTRRALGRVA